MIWIIDLSFITPNSALGEQTRSGWMFVENQYPQVPASLIEIQPSRVKLYRETVSLSSIPLPYK